jgi:hypothetical protein
LPAASAAAVVAVVVGVAVGVAQVRSARHVRTAPPVTPSVVPFNGTGAHSIVPSHLTDVREIAASAGTHDCTSTDLTVVSAQSAPTTDGWVTTTYLLRSVASANCAMRNSFMDVALVDATGTELPNDAGFPAGPVRSPDRLLVQAGELVSGEVNWARVKGLTSEPARLILLASDTPRAPANIGLSIPLTGITAPNHPTTTNSVPWRAGAIAAPPEVIRPGSLDSLKAVMHVKSTAAKGALVRYTVELHNPTDVLVRLSPCPDFVEQVLVITDTDKSITAWGGPLDCADAPNAIAPKSSVTFAFELDTTTLAAGTRYLTWWLMVGNQILPRTRAQADITVMR